MNPSEIILQKTRYKAQLDEYKNFANTMNLKPAMNRVYIDGLGRVATGRGAKINTQTGRKTAKTSQIKLKSDSESSRINIVENAIKKGEVSKTINRGKQNRHKKKQS